ncbi:MAG: DEAD/DEAH box helicase [Candidatus Micrarchaeota archaeon]
MGEILSGRLLALMKKKGFSSLTGIQKSSMPLVAEGKNVLIIAPTGWGKTEATILPILSKLEGGDKGIRVLYITPLRALNRDIVERVEWWCSKLGISVSVRHGDTSPSERTRQSKNPPQVMITTPETLQALLPAKRIGKALEGVEHVIIDEVHELFSNKRGAQLALGLERLVKKKGREFQRIGLSATVAEPETVSRFLFGRRKYVIASAGTTRKMDISLECPKPLRKHDELSERLSLDTGSTARLVRLHELCVGHKATLLFVNTRKIGEILASRMRVLEKELGEKVGKVSVHHGSLAKDERIIMEKEFKQGKLKGLIATSSMELGVDIGNVDLVVQYMSPRQAGRLVQRVGRSGHAIGKTPKGIIIASDSDDVLESVAVINSAMEGAVESENMQTGALDVLAHQLVGLVMDWGSIGLEDALAVVKGAGLYERTSLEVLASVAQQLKRQRCLWVGRDNVLGKGSKTFEYYFGNLSMIPKQKKIPVKNAATNRFISSLDDAFASSLERGSTFITKGIPWKVLDVNDEEIVVEPSESFESAIPDWIGEEIPVPFKISQRVATLRRHVDSIDICPECLGKVKRVLSKQEFMPDDRTVFIEGCEDVVVIHSCLGSKGNEALGRALSELLTSSLGSSVRAEIDAYRIALLLPHPVKATRVATMLRGLGGVRGILEKSISRSSLFRRKFIHVGRAFGVFSEDARVSQRVIEYLRDTPVYEETMREMFCNYLDVGACDWLLKRIGEGKIRVISNNVPQLSPLGRAAVVRISASELISPLEPASEVLKAFKKGLLQKRVRMLCTYCGRIAYRKLENMGKSIKCEHCGSSLMGLAGEKDEKAFRKKKEKRNKEERKTVAELMRTASLLDAYGRRGAIALSVYGVGADTAARVLARIHRGEDLLLIDLLEAQKNFIKTKRYWSA